MAVLSNGVKKEREPIRDLVLHDEGAGIWGLGIFTNIDI